MYLYLVYITSHINVEFTAASTVKISYWSAVYIPTRNQKESVQSVRMMLEAGLEGTTSTLIAEHPGLYLPLLATSFMFFWLEVCFQYFELFLFMFMLI